MEALEALEALESIAEASESTGSLGYTLEPTGTTLEGWKNEGNVLSFSFFFFRFFFCFFSRSLLVPHPRCPLSCMDIIQSKKRRQPTITELRRGDNRIHTLHIQFICYIN
jgi:hypothetical protein